MDDERAKEILTALERACPKGWLVAGIMPEKGEVDYVNKRTKKHRLMGFMEIEGDGVRVTGGRNGPVDIPIRVCKKCSGEVWDCICDSCGHEHRSS